ncbi:putative reverse transcriptase domain-containing protein [Tanacetum coccineum]
MAPTTRRGPNTPVNDTNPNNMTPESIQAMIDQALSANPPLGDGMPQVPYWDKPKERQTVQTLYYADFISVQLFKLQGDKACAALTIGGMPIKLSPRGICKDLGNTHEKQDGTSIVPHEVKSEIRNRSGGTKRSKENGDNVPTYFERFLQELTLNMYHSLLPMKPRRNSAPTPKGNQTNNRRQVIHPETTWVHNKQPFKGRMSAKVTIMRGTGERKPYGDLLPQCTKCHLHHRWPVTPSVATNEQNRALLLAFQNTGNTNVANTQKGNGAAPKGNSCFECGAPGHFKRDCPKLKNKDRGNGNAQGWVYAVRNAEKKVKMHRENPDSNVRTR